jgi:hypothetical protein
MVAYTPNKGYSLPTVAGDLNQWGVFLNQGTSILDNNMGGQAVVNVAGSSDVTATSAQAQNLVQSLTGVLTGHISYLLPNVGSFYIINNATTGNFNVTVKTTGGGSIGPIVPQNTQLAVYSRGGNVWIMDGGSTGGTINNRIFQGALTVASGGAYIVGNSTVSGFLTATGGLGVSAFGANIVGDSIVSGFLTATGGLGVSAGGANIVGNSIVSGFLTATGGLGVSAGGANIVGNSIVSGFLTVTGGLDVSAFGANIVGNSTVWGLLTSSGALTVSSGGAAITGNSTVSGFLTATGGLGVSAGGAYIVGNSAITGTLTVSVAGTSGTQAVNYSQFTPTWGSRTLTMLLPGGVRRQSGSTLVNTDGSGNASINFPTVFGAADPTVVVQNGDATLTQTPVYLIGQGDAAFQVVCPGRLSGTYRVNWTAEGGA